MKLSTLKIESLIKQHRNDGTTNIYTDDGQVSLYLRVAPKGATWFVRYRLGDTRPKETLGRFNTIGLQDARKLAEGIVYKAAHATTKTDVVGAKSKTVLDEAIKFIEARFAKAKTPKDIKYKEEFERYLLEPKYWGEIHNTPIAFIKRSVVRAIVNKRAAGKHPTTALGAIKCLKNLLVYWADLDEDNNINPLADFDPKLEKPSRDRSLTESECKAIYNTLANTPYPFGPLYQLIFLTCQRKGMIQNLTWDRVIWDSDEPHLLFTSKEMKMKKPFKLPITPAIHEVLTRVKEETKGISNFVFTTNLVKPVSGFSRSMDRVLKQSDTHGWSMHDIRRTLNDIGVDVLKLDDAKVDRALAHKPTGAGADHYNRGIPLHIVSDVITPWSKWMHSLLKEDNVLQLKAQ